MEGQMNESTHDRGLANDALSAAERRMKLEMRGRRAAVVMRNVHGSWGWQIAHMPRDVYEALLAGKMADKPDVRLEGQFHPVSEGHETARIETGRIGVMLDIPALYYCCETVVTKCYFELKAPMPPPGE